MLVQCAVFFEAYEYLNIIVSDMLLTGMDSTLQLEDHVSKTTAVVNFKGSVDVMVSPLMLEALQRYVTCVKENNVNELPDSHHYWMLTHI